MSSNWLQNTEKQIKRAIRYFVKKFLIEKEDESFKNCLAILSDPNTTYPDQIKHIPKCKRIWVFQYLPHYQFMWVFALKLLMDALEVVTKQLMCQADDTLQDPLNQLKFYVALQIALDPAGWKPGWYNIEDDVRRIVSAHGQSNEDFEQMLKTFSQPQFQRWTYITKILHWIGECNKAYPHQVSRYSTGLSDIDSIPFVFTPQSQNGDTFEIMSPKKSPEKKKEQELHMHRRSPSSPSRRPPSSSTKHRTDRSKAATTAPPSPDKEHIDPVYVPLPLSSPPELKDPTEDMNSKDMISLLKKALLNFSDEFLNDSKVSDAERELKENLDKLKSRDDKTLLIPTIPKGLNYDRFHRIGIFSLLLQALEKFTKADPSENVKSIVTRMELQEQLKLYLAMQIATMKENWTIPFDRLQDVSKLAAGTLKQGDDFETLFAEFDNKTYDPYAYINEIRKLLRNLYLDISSIFADMFPSPPKDSEPLPKSESTLSHLPVFDYVKPAPKPAGWGDKVKAWGKSLVEVGKGVSAYLYPQLTPQKIKDFQEAYKLIVQTPEDQKKFTELFLDEKGGNVRTELTDEEVKYVYHKYGLLFQQNASMRQLRLSLKRWLVVPRIRQFGGILKNIFRLIPKDKKFWAKTLGRGVFAGLSNDVLKHFLMSPELYHFNEDTQALFDHTHVPIDVAQVPQELVAGKQRFGSLLQDDRVPPPAERKEFIQTLFPDSHDDQQALQRYMENIDKSRFLTQWTEYKSVYDNHQRNPTSATEAQLHASKQALEASTFVLSQADGVQVDVNKLDPALVSDPGVNLYDPNWRNMLWWGGLTVALIVAAHSYFNYYQLKENGLISLSRPADHLAIKSHQYKFEHQDEFVETHKGLSFPPQPPASAATRMACYDYWHTVKETRHQPEQRRKLLKDLLTNIMLEHQGENRASTLLRLAHVANPNTLKMFLYYMKTSGLEGASAARKLVRSAYASVHEKQDE